MKEFIANIPMYIGNIFHKIANIFYSISYFLHMKLNTETSKVLKKTIEMITNYTNALKEELKENNETDKLKKILIKGK